MWAWGSLSGLPRNRLWDPLRSGATGVSLLHGSFPVETMDVQASKACSACSPHPMSGVHSCLEWSPPRCLSNAWDVCAVHAEYVLIRLCTTVVCACLRHPANCSQLTMSSSHGNSSAIQWSGNSPRTAVSMVPCGQKQSDVGECGTAAAAACRFATAANAVAGCAIFTFFVCQLFCLSAGLMTPPGASLKYWSVACAQLLHAASTKTSPWQGLPGGQSQITVY